MLREWMLLNELETPESKMVTWNNSYTPAKTIEYSKQQIFKVVTT